MNPYQKAAVLVVRLIGCVVALIGLIGPLSVGLMGLAGQGAPTYAAQRWVASLLWLIGGAVLIVASKPIGRRFGAGLG